MGAKSTAAARLAAIRKYGLFGALYFASACAGALLVTTLLLRLYDGGLTRASGGEFLAIVGIPWVAKPIFGLVIDRFGRKTWWIAGSALAMAVAIALLALAGDSYTTPLLALALMANSARALQDVATDGWAIEVLARNERGQAQSAMWTCAKLGEVLGAGGMIYLLAKGFPWSAACGTVAILSLLAGAVALATRVQPATATPAPASSSWRELLPTFLGVASLLAFGVALLTNVAAGTTEPVVFPWWKNMGYPKAYAAFLLTCNGWVRVCGTILAGLISRYMSRSRAFGLAVATAAATYAAIGLLEPSWGSKPMVFFMVMATAVADGMINPLVCALFMDVCSKSRFAATQFAAYMAMLNASTSLSAWTGGHLSMRLGIAGTFITGGMCQLLVLLPLALLVWIQRRKPLETN